MIEKAIKRYDDVAGLMVSVLLDSRLAFNMAESRDCPNRVFYEDRVVWVDAIFHNDEVRIGVSAKSRPKGERRQCEWLLTNAT